MAIKMDMNKAYDRVEWDFLAKILLKMGFNSSWVAKVMHCLDSVSFNLLLSGKKVSSFRPKRGLRQRDPLSPYLFIIVADVLSKMINSAVANGDLTGIRLVRGCPMLTHCFFADDSIFFLRVDDNISRRFTDLMNDYCRASGQMVNFDKSCLFFSPNTPEATIGGISDIMGISIVDSPGKYLGLPVLWGRSKVEALAFVRDKISSKVQG